MEFIFADNIQDVFDAAFLDKTPIPTPERLTKP
jgi:hypothetical protein